MKIGFLLNDLSAGGAERATVSLSNSFIEKGNEVEIITFNGDESFYPLKEDVGFTSADFEEIEHTASLNRFIGAFKRMFRLRKLVKSKKLDVLIGMSFAMTWYAVFATFFTKTKAIGTERNNPYEYKASKFNTILRKVFYFLCDGFVFQTEKSSKFFTEELKGKDIIIPNAIFNETVYELEPPENRDKIICSVGRLTKQKRFDVLIDAFALIADRFPDHNLVIFGDGELKGELEAQCKRLKLDDRVYFPGADPRCVKLVNRTNAFVLSSDMEGMPNALMEAVAMGVPCVSTRCDMGPEELIENGTNGILVEKDNPKQIAAAIFKILVDPDFAQKLSLNGRKMIKSHSVDAISDLWLDFIKKITDCR